MPTPINRYESLIASGQLSPDPVQASAMQRLNALAQNLSAKTRKKGLFASLFSPKAAPTKGLYLWGGVGRGKTLLMDLFFNNVDFPAKQRVHFHEFMLDVHDQIAQWRQLAPAKRKDHPHYHRRDEDDPIPPVARTIAANAHLLCFDEFQVSDITDAMLLGRLFDVLFQEGVTVVATSNRHPSDLYKDGLNRQLFLPSIELLKNNLDILHLDAEKDYRLERLTSTPVYYTPLTEETRQKMDEAWLAIIAGATEAIETLVVQGRTLTVPRAARGAARFTFNDLCASPLGAADYLALARRYATIFIDDIPKLTPDDRNEAKRFVTLIDALYDQHTKLVCSAAIRAEHLYDHGDGSFEFERTVSRLIEMQSMDYIALEHCPEGNCNS